MYGSSPSPTPGGSPENDAEAVSRQLRALRDHLDKSRLLREVKRSAYLDALRDAPAANVAAAGRWMNNAWGAEHLLRQSVRHLAGEGLAQAVQWTFGQAYYSAYAGLQAFTVARNEPYSTHRAVRRRFVRRVRDGKYPSAVSLLAAGRPEAPTLVRVDASGTADPAGRSADVAVTVDADLVRFFRATRRHLASRRVESGTEHRAAPDEAAAAGRAAEPPPERPAGRADEGDDLEPTSVLDLLYRLHLDLRTQRRLAGHDVLVDDGSIHRSLIHVASYLNMVHEAWTAALVGMDAVRSMKGADAPFDFATRRMDLAARIVA
jgi:hypothetical protein